MYARYPYRGLYSEGRRNYAPVWLARFNQTNTDYEVLLTSRILQKLGIAIFITRLGHRILRVHKNLSTKRLGAVGGGRVWSSRLSIVMFKPLTAGDVELQCSLHELLRSMRGKGGGGRRSRAASAGRPSGPGQVTRWTRILPVLRMACESPTVVALLQADKLFVPKSG